MADADVPIKYMDRTRHYYRALGYTQDYIWATFDAALFQPAKPLSEMRVVLITTASPLDFDGVKRVWSPTFLHLRRNCSPITWPGTRNRHTQTTGPVFSRLKPLRSWHRKACFVAWRRVSTACLPNTASAKRLRKMRRKFSHAFAKIGRTPQFYVPFVLFAIRPSAGGPSPRNERNSNRNFGSALDVVEHCGVPRFYFTDFPLGNPCGHPWQPEMQREIVRQALSLFETAITPRTTVKAPFSWKEDGVAWRARYGRVDPTEKERLLKLGEERRRQQAMAKQILAERAAPKA